MNDPERPGDASISLLVSTSLHRREKTAQIDKLFATNIFMIEDGPTRGLTERNTHPPKQRLRNQELFDDTSQFETSVLVAPNFTGRDKNHAKKTCMKP